MASKPDSDAPQETLNSKQPKPYGSVIISLENCLLSEDRLSKTPSSEDGLDPEAEFDLRLVGCELIQSAGILLRLPQVAMATGQVLFQRFYYSKSFVRHPMEVTAMGCVCLASKVEEAPRRIRDVVSIFHHLRQLRVGKPIQPMLLDQTYINLKNQVIKAERRVLKELGFCVHVKHPHKIVVVYLQLLGLERSRKLAQMSWNYMNDSLRTDVWVRYSPETIASACIFLSAKFLGIPLPTQPAWYLVFGAQETDLKLIAIRLIQLYKRPKPDTELLEKTISTLQEAYQEARQKRLGIVAESHSSGQSPVCSRPPSPSKNSAAENKESITNGVETKEADDEKSPKLSSKSRSEDKRREKHLSKSLSLSRSRSPSVEVEREKRHRKHRKRHTRSRSRSPVRSRDRKEKDREKEDRHSSRSSLTKRSHKYEREERYKEKERDRDREKLDRYSSKEERYYERDKDRHRSKSDKEKDRRR